MSFAAPARGLEPLRPVALAQTQDAQAGAEALLGMRLGGQDRLEQRDRGRSDLGGLPHQARRRPLGVAPVRARHVLVEGGVPVLQPRARMTGDAAALAKDLDRGVGDARFDLLTNQPRRHRIVVIGNLDVIIGRDAALAPFRIPIGLVGKRCEHRPLQRLEQLLPALAELAHDAVVEIGDILADRLVELCEGEKPAIANPRQHPSLHDQIAVTGHFDPPDTIFSFD